MDNTEKPFIVTRKRVTIVTRRYNSKYGDDRVCLCGHAYYRHFDL